MLPHTRMIGLLPWMSARLSSSWFENRLGFEEFPEAVSLHQKGDKEGPPAKSGKKANSIEKETKDGKMGTLAFLGVALTATEAAVAAPEKRAGYQNFMADDADGGEEERVWSTR